MLCAFVLLRERFLKPLDFLKRPFTPAPGPRSQLSELVFLAAGTLAQMDTHTPSASVPGLAGHIGC